MRSRKTVNTIAVKLAPAVIKMVMAAVTQGVAARDRVAARDKIECWFLLPMKHEAEI
jgi:hypothetical protein